MPPVTAEQLAALEHDYRYGSDRLVRQRSQIVLLAYELDTRKEIARVMRCSEATVGRALARYLDGGRSALRRRPLKSHVASRTLAWQKALAQAMEAGPEACGVSRPTWTAPLLAEHLQRQTGVAVGERTVRRGLASLGCRLGRPTWSVRHVAEEQADYHPKGKGSKRS
jgi:transposase